METKKMDISQVGTILADHVATLAGLTQSVGDATSTYILRHLEPRLRQGLVRIAVIGITGSGKSTMVNALVEQFALPENPSISSPIPVWMGYGASEAATAEVYLSQDGDLKREEMDTLTFRKTYCYNTKDILDKDRSRYNAVEFGAVKLPAPVLQDDLTLIDTLGIAATSVDSRKTIRVLEEGVDAVLFVSESSNLNLEEQKFLTRYVLGQKRNAGSATSLGIIKKTIAPEDIYFVYNNFYGVPDRTAFSESVRALYRGCGLQMSPERIDTLARENVFYINALEARLGRVGVYPYVDSAPDGSDEDSRFFLEEMEDHEQEILDDSDPQTLVRDSGIQTLSDGIRQITRGLTRGADNVASARIRELLPVVDGIIQSANDRISLEHLDITELEQQKERFARLKEDDLEEQRKIKAALSEKNREYRSAFTALLHALRGELLADCERHARHHPMPENFQQTYRDYLDKDPRQREHYLQSLMPELIRNTYEYCTQRLICALDERKGDAEKTPFSVMEETREFIAMQAILLNARIESLRAAGADRLGVFFPQPIIVEELFKKLELDLKQRIKEIIAESCKLCGKRFEEDMRRHVAKCKLGFFKSILEHILRNQAPKWLWTNIQEQLFVPLATDVVNGMAERTQQIIFDETTAAFDKTKDEICMSHMTLFVSLEMAVARLEKEILAAEDSAKERTEEMETLKRACEAIQQDILVMLSRLQQG